MCRLNNLIDERKCYEEVRRIRWPHGVRCPGCTSNKITQRGRNHRQQECRRYTCKNCGKRFDDLTGTLFMGRHQPLSVWFADLYLMGLNVSNRQIAEELNLNESDGQAMAEALRGGIIQRRSKVRMSGVVECDAVYVVAGHKGRPDRIQGRAPRCRRLQGAPGRGTLEKEKPPIFGMIERGGEVRIVMLENVQQKTIRPLIEATIEPGTVVNTDEYVIYAALPQWGYVHQSVCHSRGEYARDEDGDGFHEVHVNTMEGFWSLLRSWLRPHRGISQEKLPIYLGFFEFVHNVRRRGRALLGSLLDTLLQPVACPQNPI
ncbi:MAG: IS1595 family transposase [Candidatus Contendobacter sp.]